MAELSSQPAHGEVLLFTADGAFSYRADPDFDGIDHFTYQVSDGLGLSAEATVTVVADACESCARGDFFLAVWTTSGALRSIHCRVDAGGLPTCETDANGVLVLGEPMCQTR